MNKKRLCVALLSGAMAAIVMAGGINAQIVSGYETLKTSLRKTANLTNATFDASFKLGGGAEVYETGRQVVKVDAASKKRATINYDSDGDVAYETLVHDRKNIHVNYMDDGPYYNVYEHDVSYERNFTFLEAPEEVLDILEICADAFSGSAKDSLERTGLENGYAVDGQLDQTQIPEIANAFLNLAVSQINESKKWYDESDYKPEANSFEGKLYYNDIKSAYVNSVTLDSQVDQNGYLDSLSAATQIMFKAADGSLIPLDFYMDMKVTDKNATTINIPVLTEDMENVDIQKYGATVERTEEEQALFDRAMLYQGEISNRAYNVENLSEEEKLELIEAMDALEAILNLEEPEETEDTLQSEAAATTAPDEQSDGDVPTEQSSDDAALDEQSGGDVPAASDDQEGVLPEEPAAEANPEETEPEVVSKADEEEATDTNQETGSVAQDEPADGVPDNAEPEPQAIEAPAAGETTDSGTEE